MEIIFRKAVQEDLDAIWSILQLAIERRKKDGSSQWQDGYPNPTVVKNDIEKEAGFVLVQSEVIVGYCAIFINDEPAYEKIKGAWLTSGDFVVYHRVAISENHLGQGLAKKLLSSIEEFTKSNNIKSVRADTNFDNPGMLSLFEKLGYTYCGEVVFRDSPRKAFEKILG